MLSDRDRRQFDATLVFCEYGETMLAVQLFEQQLGMLWLVTRDDWARQKGGFTKRNIRKALRRIIHVHNAGTATAFKRELEGKIEADLLDEISQAIVWRNILSHRYLRERLRQDEKRMFKDGTADQLESLRKSFSETGGDKIFPLWQQIGREKAEANGATTQTPDEVRAVMTDVVQQITEGGSWERPENRQ